MRAAATRRRERFCKHRSSQGFLPRLLAKAFRQGFLPSLAAVAGLGRPPRMAGMKSTRTISARSRPVNRKMGK
jgi:hypothetical protein